ncbi:MAG: signal peptide peptidase SppA [Myxococcales bacterium]|nr:signal peptide peptidase SppA [Myxococcales bacterium]
MLRLLFASLRFVLALPFTLTRYALARLRPRDVVLQLDLDALHPLFTQPAHLLARLQGQTPRLDQLTLLARLERARDDDRVQTIYVRIGALRGGWATHFGLREAIRLAAERPNCRVVAFVAQPDLRSLWLASAADEVWLPPDVPVTSQGFGAEVTFFGEALDRAGVEVDVLTAGAYKAALEPFTRTEPSPANAEMIRALLQSMRQVVEAEIGGRRGEDVELDLLGGGPAQPEVFVETGLADAIVPEEQVRERLGCPEDGDTRLVGLEDYAGPVRPWPRWPRRPARLGLIEIKGLIKDGRGPGPTDRAVVAACDAARRDDRVRGVLLHIDSGGGSATASERMWRAVRALNAEKPVVALLGDTAASGGYYVATAARQIVCPPTTLTGSIGVLAAKPVAAGLLARLGIHQTRFELHPRATMFSAGRPFTDDERAALAASIEHTYRLFLRRVAEGRALTTDEVEPLAQGRVWTGHDAQQSRLIDRRGGLPAALDVLGEAAGVADRRLRRVGPRRTLLQRLLRQTGAAEAVEPLELLALTRDTRALAWCPVRLD